MVDAEYESLRNRVVMGPGSVDRVADEVRRLGASRVMLISGARTAKTNLVARVSNALGPLLVENFNSVVEHSGTHIVEEAAERAASSQVDLLLPVGGGSSSDTAKGVAILLSEGAPLKKHANQFIPPSTLIQQQLNQPKLPILAIPTTASAAEVTPGLGIRDADGQKLLFWDAKVAARTILLDPDALLEVPPPLLATSGMNALAHCIEGLYSKKRNPIAEGFALQGLRLLARGLPVAVSRKENLEARSQVLYGAHLSGMTIASTRTCLHHGICHVLGALGGLAHGTANSIMLPHVMRFNSRVSASELKLAAQALGADVGGLSDDEASEAAIAAIVRLQQALGVTLRLRDTPLKRDLLPRIADHAMRDRAIYFNPGPALTSEEVLKVLDAAW